MPEQLVSDTDHVALSRLVEEISWRIDHGRADSVWELFVPDGVLATSGAPWSVTTPSAPGARPAPPRPRGRGTSSRACDSPTLATAARGAARCLLCSFMRVTVAARLSRR